MAEGRPPADAGLDDYCERFEAALAEGRAVELADFAPPADDPLHTAVVAELIRIDLEHGWARGEPTPLDVYLARFPALRADRDLLTAVAFEEYRQRLQAGQPAAPEEYAVALHIVTDDWRLPAPVAVAPSRLSRFARSTPGRDAPITSAFPEVGGDFAGFHLLAELGRGSFARVYVARQGDLADRLVVLKVGADLFDESQTLAQLQHTYIVPIYSAHRVDGLQALCMPYLGATTFADLLAALRDQKRCPTTGPELAATLLASRRAFAPPAAPPMAPGAGHRPEASREAISAWRSLQGKSYAQSVLWVGARLAEGLVHAHERGVQHRDLKPANVLWTDDGRPMLLDFNLSENRRGPGPRAVGGTLPYMAPEQLARFAGERTTLDGRADIYSLGLLLHELLVGRPAFPVHEGDSLDGLLPRYRADRTTAPPPLASVDRSITPAIDAIVRRCLAPNPADRYQSAAELQEDLDCQSLDLPLRHTREPSLAERSRKWLRRHPRLTSAGTVAAFALVLGLFLATALWLGRQQLARYEASQRAADLVDALRLVQFHYLASRAAGTEGLRRADAAARALREESGEFINFDWRPGPALLLLPAEDRAAFQRAVGDLLLVRARTLALHDPDEAILVNRAAETWYGEPPRVLHLQRADLLEKVHRVDEAEASRRALASRRDDLPRDLAAQASELSAQGRPRDALPLLERATRLDPRDFWAWFDRGLCHEALEQDADAWACFSAALALAPRFAPTAFKRGLASLRLQRFAEAEADFDLALMLQPDFVEARLNRALAIIGQSRHAAALADLDALLDGDERCTRVWFLRARVRSALGDQEGARRDRLEGLRREPTDDASWVARGVARLPNDPAGALADFQAALRLNPRSHAALQNQAHVLSEHLGRPAEALATLDQLLQLYGDALPARRGRAVILARLGRRAEALAAARDCLTRDSSPATLYQLAGVHALTSREQPADREQAMRLLTLAIQQGYGGELLAGDRDLDPLRAEPAFQALARSIRADHSPIGAAEGTVPPASLP